MTHRAVSIRPYPHPKRFLDALVDPFMRLMSGAPLESAQRTHVWNLRALALDERAALDEAYMLTVTGSYAGRLKRVGLKHLGLFHLPLVGGWKDYVVIEPVTPQEEWQVGFIRDDEYEKSAYFSLIPLAGPVRLLKTPEGTHAKFFGVDSRGLQIPLRIIGEGRIGDGKFPRVRLL